MENIKYGKRREGRWTPIRAEAQDTRANPNSWETHLVRKNWDIGLLRALNPWLMVMMMMMVQIIIRLNLTLNFQCVHWYKRLNVDFLKILFSLPINLCVVRILLTLEM